MKYQLVYAQRALKDIDKLDAKTKSRIGDALLRHKDRLIAQSTRLTDPRIGTYRFRVGDYRIIFDVEGSEIVILRVGHRREIYKRTK
ncbi:MAG: type II toxin-antitoxin system RelE/ParE family toxin [Nitrospiraceae bacterium]|nr:type II toxin-antitoxin system RelE/ParE family toxin [Nitrospiraceae bacterium]